MKSAWNIKNKGLIGTTEQAAEKDIIHDGNDRRG